MNRGRFITFEGSEGCGKSTQLALLAERLQKAGRTVRTLREPGGTPLGEELRTLLKHHPAGRQMTPEAELLLMNASRSQLLRDVIRPALAAGEMVLCDRFHDSSIAYQGYGRRLELSQVRTMIDFAIGDLRPDLTILLVVPRSVAQARMKRRHLAAAPVSDRFEEEEQSFFDRVDSGYREIAAAEPDRIHVVDGAGEIPAIAVRIAVVARTIPGLLPDE